MELKPFLQKINPRLIAVHGIAIWVFVFAFELFARLRYMTIFLQCGTNDETPRFVNPSFIGTRSPKFYALLIEFLAPLIGLMAGFIISLLICHVKKWFWFNSLLSVFFVFLLLIFDITGPGYLNQLHILENNSFATNKGSYYIINSLLLASSFLLFFLRPANDFICGSIVLKKESNPII